MSTTPDPAAEPTAAEPSGPSGAHADPYDAGMAVRRRVLGDAHVDRAQAGITDLTRDFQALITRYAWGSVWTRPGLDARTRSAITLTALLAGGHWDEFRMHVAAALRNGLTAPEISEVVLQAAIYCGVPAANHAFGIVRAVFDEAEPAAGPDGVGPSDAGSRGVGPGGVGPGGVGPGEVGPGGGAGSGQVGPS